MLDLVDRPAPVVGLRLESPTARALLVARALGAFAGLRGIAALGRLLKRRRRRGSGGGRRGRGRAGGCG